ncbi:MAG: hypothetical protein JW775_07795 [Candidatus Aminicenantes bacterium]|nr:hypothetical protein [Candidatus Aminicenantes bacterium]
MRLRILLTLLLAVGAAGALAAQDAPAKPSDVAGVWEMTIQTPQGDMPSDATFAQEGDKIRFTMPGFQGMEMMGEGTITGQELEWTVILSTSQGDFMLVFKGKVEGDMRSGEVQAGDFGAFPWTAKKKQ